MPIDLTALWLRRNLKGFGARFGNYAEASIRISKGCHDGSSEPFQEVDKHKTTDASFTCLEDSRNLICAVNLPQNPVFIGREPQLEELRSYFSQIAKDGHPNSYAVQGCGGIGKTQVALEYTYRSRSLYNAIFWVNARESAELVGAYGVIGRRLKLFETDDIDLPKIEKVRDWLERTGLSIYVPHRCRVLTFPDLRWLIVFDDVCDWDSISPFLPLSCNAASSILVTSQTSGDWCAHNLQLTGFDSNVGSEMLLDQLKGIASEENEADHDSARWISEFLGGSPLLINQASGFIKACACSLKEFIARPIVVNRKAGANKYSYERSFQQVIDRTVENLSEDARNLLFMLAYLDHRNVREDLLLHNHHHSCLKFLQRGESG